MCVQTFIPVHTGEGQKKTGSGLRLPNSLDTGSFIETEAHCILTNLATSPSSLTFFSLIPYLNQDPRCPWLSTEVSGIWTQALRLLWQGRAISLARVFCIFAWTSSLYIRWHTHLCLLEREHLVNDLSQERPQVQIRESPNNGVKEMREERRFNYGGNHVRQEDSSYWGPVVGLCLPYRASTGTWGTSFESEEKGHVRDASRKGL